MRLTSKVCVVGDFAVGKTSVIERFVSNHFSGKYLSTVGVKIDTKEIEQSALDVTHKLVIWDVAGSDRFGDQEFAYLRGASGYIYVADGTRSLTIKTVETVQSQVVDKFGAAPSVLLVNKRDLTAEWEVSDERFESLSASFNGAFKTSAKTGDAVEVAFAGLAQLIVENELREK